MRIGNMSNIALIFISLLFAEIKPNSPTQSNRPELCFLIIGQSNAVGIAPVSGNESPLNSAGVSRVFMWSASNNRWEIATDPMEHITESDQGVSFARTFARKVHEEYKQTVGIIPAARSGSSLGEGYWARYGDGYNEAVKRSRAALPSCKTFGGFLWAQGENDANASYASSYQTNLEAMISAMRSDLNTSADFVAAKLPDFAVTAYAPHGATVNTAIENVSSSDYSFISTDDLSNFDGSHFDTASQITIGERFYTAWKTLQ